MAVTPEITQEIQRLIDTATANLIGRVAEVERVMGETRNEATSIMTRLGAQEHATINLTSMIDGQTQRPDGNTKKPKISQK